MKRHTLLAGALILVLSGSFLAEELLLGAWMGGGDRVGNGEGQGLALGVEDRGDVFATGGIDPNLVGWWKLNEGRGDVGEDSSGRGNDGIIHNLNGGLGPNGSVWVVDKERGVVLSFNGDDASGAYVDAGRVIPAMTLTSDFTWAFWARQDVGQPTGAAGGGGDDVIIGNRYGGTETPLQFIKFTPAKFEYYNDDPSYAMAIDYADVPGGLWVHHVGVKKGATLAYYRNAIETGTSTLTKTMDQNPFFMGGDAGGERWRGSLSDVRLYDRALSEAEVRALVEGLQGEYFTNMTLSGSPAVTRLDPDINFDWGEGEVFPGTWDNCSVRWTGEVEPASTGAYLFYVNTDDGARLWLDGKLIIDAWMDQASTEYAGGPILLVGGQRYPLRLEWYENAGFAVCELRWSSPSTPKQVIPSGRLHPAAPSIGPRITLNPASGPAGSFFLITGSGFAASAVGNVNFAGASSVVVTTTPTGTFSTSMAVPSVPAGGYPVDADIPAGGAVEASATFQVFLASSGNPTSQPGTATFCPAVVTQCPAVSTQCPAVNTQCPASATKCPPVNTQCPPASPTSCPYALTQCPPRSTNCPPVSTQCPTTSTQCPVVSTQCPAVSTRCPPTMTQCSPTKCMSTPTVCPTVSTQCPTVSTQCPAVHTQCPGAFTECPPVSTNCPKTATACFIQPTLCPATSSRCPVVSTQCPPATTTCPAVSTQCPPNATYCPLVSTSCPYLSTSCPPRNTQCPAVNTKCPEEITKCMAAVATVCPLGVTSCPPAPTACPYVYTICPPFPLCKRGSVGKTQYSSSEFCPAIDAPCPLVLPGPDLLMKPRADGRIWRN